MPRESPMLKVLREIRDELREHGVILREHGERLDRLERRQSETEVRLASELVEVTRAVDGVRDLLRDKLDDRARVDDLEKRVTSLETRVGS